MRQNAALRERRRGGLSTCRRSEANRHDRMVARDDIEACRCQALAQIDAHRSQAREVDLTLFDQVQRAKRGGGDRGHQGIGEQIGASELAQRIDHGLRPRHESAGRATQCLAERADENVDRGGLRLRLGGSAPRLADDPNAMRVIHDEECLALSTQRGQGLERCLRAIHGEHAVAHQQTCAGVVRFVEGPRGAVDIAMRVTKAGGPAQAYAVDDARMIERVGEHGVLIAQQRLEERAVGVESRREQRACLGAEKVGQPLLQFPMQRMRAADEANRGHAQAEARNGFRRRLDDACVAGQPEVIVGAQIEIPAWRLGGARVRGDAAALRRADRDLALEGVPLDERLPAGFETGAQRLSEHDPPRRSRPPASRPDRRANPSRCERSSGSARPACHRRRRRRSGA